MTLIFAFGLTRSLFNLGTAMKTIDTTTISTVNSVVRKVQALWWGYSGQALPSWATLIFDISKEVYQCHDRTVLCYSPTMLLG